MQRVMRPPRSVKSVVSIYETVTYKDDPMLFHAASLMW